MQKRKNNKEFHKDITSIEQAYKILYTDKDEKLSIIPTLHQHTILRLLKYHIEWLNDKENIENQVKLHT
jgi:hypothetical protein